MGRRMTAAERRSLRLWLLALTLGSAVGCLMVLMGSLDNEATAVPWVTLALGIVGLWVIRPRK